MNIKNYFLKKEKKLIRFFFLERERELVLKLMIFSNRFPSYMYNMHAKILYIMSLFWGFITVFFKLVDLFHFCRKIIYTECFDRFKASDNIVHEQHTNHKQWRLIWIVFSFLYMFLNVSDISNIVHTCALKLTKW